MSKYKILVKITGSIAAYKSAYLISRLVQDGNEVKVAASESAFKFIGTSTLEGLTANPVYTDSFEAGKMMSHINLVKWADLTIVCPATANTINKMAVGIGDTLLTSLFLAHDWNKPYLVAPAMNTAMFNHPVTQESINKLSGYGVNILPTADGYLACGDYGSGKLLEPDAILNHIYSSIRNRNNNNNILITAGGTSENIDGIRNITNISTGKTASAIARYFIQKGYNVTYLSANDAAKPNGPYQLEEFYDFESLNQGVKKLLKNNSYDVVIHNAAVSDYSLESVNTGTKTIAAPLNDKISSSSESITFNMKRNFKIVDKIKSYSKNKTVKLVSFKFTNEPVESSMLEQVNNLLANSGSDFVVQNDLQDRDKLNVQSIFNIFNNSGKLDSYKTVSQLAYGLDKLIFNTME